jgi:hypothetical protein
LDFIGFASRPVLRKFTAKLAGMQVIENTKQAGADGTVLSHHSWWFSANADGEVDVGSSMHDPRTLQQNCHALIYAHGIHRLVP